MFQIAEVIQISKSEVVFEIRSQDGVDVVDITGQLDAFTTPEVKAEFKTLTDGRHYKLALNFGEVDYVNSTGIGAVLAVAQQVRKRKGDLKIFGMKADIRKVFDLVGASKILDIFETEQEALNSF
jgi:anti-sigma B factor antagonist